MSVPYIAHMGKLPGKTEYSGRRRGATRKSGFKSHKDSTGAEFQFGAGEAFKLAAGSSLILRFKFPRDPGDQFTGFGVYFRIRGDVSVTIENPNTKKGTKEINVYPNWSKLGSTWKSENGQEPVVVSFIAKSETVLDLYDAGCGVIWHEYFEEARPAIMTNLHLFSPEGNFYKILGDVENNHQKDIAEDEPEIALKKCNRCARYLPINIDDERETLSFSNHCTARACTHTGFGRLKDQVTGATITLDHGFQLECRICKKFAVNAALNPQRTSAQMKEDGQRRRHFELLIAELYKMSPQLAYRHNTGRELTDDVWKKFEKKCFNCDADLPSPQSMHLDHTRPLALLWQLDETATALCPQCNSSKRDRSPIEFYSAEKLSELSEITGISIREISAPHPNEEILKALIENVDWVMKDFMARKDIQKVRDGKVTAELICKALDKVIDRSSFVRKFSFLKEYRKIYH